MIVKELWLSEEENDIDAKDKIQDVNVEKRLYSTSDAKLRFEFYLQKDEKYYAIFRFDTTLFRTLPLKSYAAGFIETALISSLDRLSKYNFTNISNTKTPLSLTDIYNYNNRRFEYPILKDTSFKKGVYASFEEFKNNNPSIPEFEVKKGKLGDVLYVKMENGESVASRSVWGYCDGKKLYIKTGDNYYQLYRIDNSFYFNGSKEISRKERRGQYNEKYITYRNILSPLKLNIETGNIY
jgi:hypothetical protein